MIGPPETWDVIEGVNEKSPAKPGISLSLFGEHLSCQVITQEAEAHTQDH